MKTIAKIEIGQPRVAGPDSTTARYYIYTDCLDVIHIEDRRTRTWTRSGGRTIGRVEITGPMFFHGTPEDVGEKIHKIIRARLVADGICYENRWGTLFPED
jgi:hypothetical protein